MPVQNQLNYIQLFEMKAMEAKLKQFHLFIFHKLACLEQNFYERVLSIWVFIFPWRALYMVMVSLCS